MTYANYSTSESQHRQLIRIVAYHGLHSTCTKLPFYIWILISPRKIILQDEVGLISWVVICNLLFNTDNMAFATT